MPNTSEVAEQSVKLRSKCSTSRPGVVTKPTLKAVPAQKDLTKRIVNNSPSGAEAQLSGLHRNRF